MSCGQSGRSAPAPPPSGTQGTPRPCTPRLYPICASVGGIAQPHAPKAAAIVDAPVDTTTTALLSPAPSPLSVPATVADADGLWNLALPIGATLLFVGMVIAGVFVLRAIITRRNPDIEP